MFTLHKPIQGVKLLFFSDSHLAPKFFKVVAISKNVDRHFQWQTKRFFNAVSVLDRPSKIKFGIRSLTCYKVDTRMDDIQRSSSPKYKMASSYRSRCMCCARFGNKLNEEVCRVFPIWRLISGFGRHSETFSRIGACIRRNFSPCHLKSCNFYVFQISWTSAFANVFERGNESLTGIWPRSL